MTNDLTNYGTYTYQFFPIANVLVDFRSQRNPKDSISLQTKMRKKWDWDLCMPVYINVRADGSQAVMDGQNRIIGARMHGIEALPAFVFNNLTFEQESEMFLLLNRERVPVSPVDVFRNRVNIQDESALAILSTLDKYGIVIQKNSKNKYATVAVRTLDKLYNDGVLDQVLRVTENCWGGGEFSAQENFLNSYFLKGLGMFLSNSWNTKGDEEKGISSIEIRPSVDTLIQAIKINKECTPTWIMKEASLKNPIATGADKWRAIANVIATQVYSKKLKGSNRLASIAR